MATPAISNRKDILTARQSLRPVRRQGGFGNMFGKELGEWFGTRRWLWQIIIWVILINGSAAFMLFAVPKLDPSGFPASEGAVPNVEEIVMFGLAMYFSMAVVAGSIGTVILAQDEVIRERQSGTAAWILSKPVSRTSFILAKLFSNLVGVLVFIVVLPGLITYAEVALAAGSMPAPLPFLASVGVVLLALVFYVSLTIMLGVFFEQRAALLGIAFGMILGVEIVSGFLPGIGYILPVNMDNIALMAAQGQALDAVSISQLVSTVGLSILFAAVGLWRFQREEF